MPARSVITIGNFDGVHRGHRAIVARGRAMADAHRCDLVALTFDPHPATVLRPGTEPPRLMSRPRKLETLRKLGVDRVVVLEPTPALLGQPPEVFIESLARGHQPIAVVEGPDFRFGAGRRGDNALLAELGRRHGFETIVVERVEVALNDMLIAPVSSSMVRWLLSRGRVADAARCLGQAYELEGKVVVGEKRGRTIGVPTINLDPAVLSEFAMPGDGVYAGVVELCDAGEPPRTIPGAVSVGVKPTFGHRARTVEAHLLDFTGDLYGGTVRIRFARWLRDQQAFPSLAALKDQLARDINRSRELAGMGLLAEPTRDRPAAITS